MPLRQEGNVTEEASSKPAGNVQPDENVLSYIDETGKKDGKVQQIISEHTDKPTLLIIDDNSDIRQYVRFVLQTTISFLRHPTVRKVLPWRRKRCPTLWCVT